MEQLETFFSISEYTKFFLLSCVYGIPIGIVFDIFRILRAILPHNKILVAIEDIIFIMLYGVFLITFSIIYTRSEFRVYYIVGNILGFTVYFFTLGTIVIGVIRKSVEGIKRVVRFFYRILVKPIVKIICKIFNKIIEFIKTICKINKKCSKNNEMDLIDDSDLLYNNAKVE